MTHAKIPSQGRMAEKANVSRETVNNLLGQKVDADPGTLEKLARACGVPIPSVEWRFSAQGGPESPEDALSWVAEAQAALEQAARLLRGRASGSPEARDGVLLAHEDLKQEQKAQPPRATRRRKAG